MSARILLVFSVVYAGMLLGRLPRLQLDRTGVALLGAIVLVAGGDVALAEAARAVDGPTMALLFALMVLSAQLRLGGFYTRISLGLAGRALPPAALLLVLVLTVGLLSAVFTNDVVCLAVAPVTIDVCRRRGLDPVPFLLGVACASNVGSAATLIGNPQNILIGQSLRLSFGDYLALAGPPAALGLLAVWGIVAFQCRRDWRHRLGEGGSVGVGLPSPAFDRWQTAKGLAVAGVLLLAFLFTSWPRELVALGGAGLLLCSRRLQSRDMLSLVDWHLLVLFAGLFVVNDALARTPVLPGIVDGLASRGLDPAQPAWLFASSVVLSNVVSNVPAVMLLLSLAQGAWTGPVLALSSTLAGNLLAVGSVANLIVLDAAARGGCAIGWRRHAWTGVPVTLATLAIAAAWLAWRA